MYMSPGMCLTLDPFDQETVASGVCVLALVAISTCLPDGFHVVGSCLEKVEE